MLLTASFRGWYSGKLALVVESERESAIHKGAVATVTLAKDVATDAHCDKPVVSNARLQPSKCNV